jgi:hypothetical protein
MFLEYQVLAHATVQPRGRNRRHDNIPGMTPLFTKLNLASHTTIYVLNAPAHFEYELAALKGVKVIRAIKGKISFAIAFVMKQADLDRISSGLIEAADGDAILWMAYPKGTSKKYRCEFNRDSGWAVLGKGGYEPVRQVAIDEDWSALRFRKAEYIKSMTRNPEGAISKAGKQRAGAR